MATPQPTAASSREMDGWDQILNRSIPLNDTRVHGIKDDIETWGGWALSILSRVDHPIIQKLLCQILKRTVQVDISQARESVDLSILKERFYNRGQDAARVPLDELDLGPVAFDQAKNFVEMMDRQEGKSPNVKFQGDISFGSAEDFYFGLTHLVGEPAFLDLAGAVMAEHCTAPVCDQVFTARNYKVTTTPRREWELVLGANKDLVLEGGVLNNKKMAPRTFADLDDLKQSLYHVYQHVDKDTIDKIGLTTLEIACLRMYTGESHYSLITICARLLCSF